LSTYTLGGLLATLGKALHILEVSIQKSGDPSLGFEIKIKKSLMIWYLMYPFQFFEFLKTLIEKILGLI